MIDQQLDVLYYGGTEFSIIEKRGDLFVLQANKQAFDLFCDNNIAGYYCEYEVSDEFLYLRQLNMSYPDLELKINGIKGKYIERIDESKLTHKEKLERYMGVNQSLETKMRERHGGEYIFQNINLPMKQFAGKLLIGTNFEEDYDIPNLAFGKAWSFTRVYELCFDNGKISACMDLSEYAKKLRVLYCDITEGKEIRETSIKFADWNRIVSEIPNNEFARSWEYEDGSIIWRL